MGHGPFRAGGLWGGVIEGGHCWGGAYAGGHPPTPIGASSPFRQLLAEVAHSEFQPLKISHGDTPCRFLSENHYNIRTNHKEKAG